MLYPKVINTDDNFVTSGRIISKCKKFRERCNFNVFCASLIFFCVPIMVSSNSDRTKPLTYEEIYNNTNYVQLSYNTRPYYTTTPKSHKTKESEVNSQRYNISQEDIKGNELEYEEYDEVENHKGFSKDLLVALSHDPFRFSVTEEDYLKGVRNMDPAEYMKKKENRGKRGVLHLYNMVSCTTGCNPVSYVGYGCYCGFLGNGRPTDGIDECCRIHDRCYENFRCPLNTVYFQPYLWKCSGGQPFCALENYRTQHQFVNGCAAQLCECDRRFAMCISRYACPRKRALCVTSPLRLLQNLLFGK